MVASLSYVVHIPGCTCNLYHAQTDEQAPLPDAPSQLLDRVQLGYSRAGGFTFNCQVGEVAPLQEWLLLVSSGR